MMNSNENDSAVDAHGHVIPEMAQKKETRVRVNEPNYTRNTANLDINEMFQLLMEKYCTFIQ